MQNGDLEVQLGNLDINKFVSKFATCQGKPITNWGKIKDGKE